MTLPVHRPPITLTPPPGDLNNVNYELQYILVHWWQDHGHPGFIYTHWEQRPAHLDCYHSKVNAAQIAEKHHC